MIGHRLAGAMTKIALHKRTASNAVAVCSRTPGSLSALAARAEQAPDPRVADLVQSGKLRIALGLGSPALALKDPKSGEVRGPARVRSASDQDIETC
jgi:hypothetical protein